MKREVGLNARITRQRRHIDFTLERGRQKRNSAETLFIPLRANQAEALRRYREAVPETRAPGLVRFHLHHGGDTHLKELEFYPFGEHNYAVEGEFKPTRLGIGTLVHHAVVEHLAKRFPGHVISHSPGTLVPRQKQLLEMGIDPKKEYTIEKYLQIIRRHMKRKYGMIFQETEVNNAEMAKAS